MKQLSRVVWSEGMYLGPHHFQVQGRYFEDSIRFVTSSLWFEAWGLIGCELDSEALLNGNLALLHARGVFPDGLAFHMPDHDALPAPRAFADAFPVTRDTVTVLLTVPPMKPNGLNCVPAEENPGANVRFAAQPVSLFDETTGRDEKAVRLGRKNVRLVLDTEPFDPTQSIALARVQRDGSGGFVFDPTFIPPCIQLGASERLLSILVRLIEILEEKSSTLSRGKTAGASLWTEYSTSEIASFWMLHSVNAAVPELRHILRVKKGHPEELYTTMARLGGALCTFALESHPRNVPLYDHRHLDKTFEALDLHIRTHLETIVPTRFVEIPLEKTADYFYTGDVADTRALNKSRWILAVRCRIGEAEVIRRTPMLAKLSSADWVPKLVERAMAGMALTHLPVPPSAIRSRVDAQYFSVTCADPHWSQINRTRQVGLYIPGDLPDPQLELFAILDA
ncbi:MAG: type VI secretion system baseplate subunit TssK [Acidobacteriota bacterium]|jgi:type VI secretion system protein ImpJ|nr:type VI secretion system baseplate subunit TssK [Bryobacteraceae bacterium CoA2 C42]MCA2964575.1 type VI secretion system baseplate subunit TssK [Acidobacteriaceae bacterium]